MKKKELLIRHRELCDIYIKLMNDKDVMLNWTKPQYEALYASQIGVLKVEKLKLELKAKSLKSQIQMAMAAVNKNQTSDFNQIEQHISEKLIEAEMQIVEESIKIEKAKCFLTHLASPDDKTDIRKIFRRLAKAFHPDVNRGITKNNTEIWNKILTAYEHGNVEQLKAFEIIYADEIHAVEDSKNELSEDELTLMNDTLIEGIKVLEHEISEMSKLFPFNLHDKINNEEWVENQQTELKEAIDKLKRYITQLEKDYQNLKTSYE